MISDLFDAPEAYRESWDYSFTHGLFMEAVWKAMSTSLTDSGAVRHVPPHTVFMRSLEVLDCLYMSTSLMETNVETGSPWATVTGYGSGAIWVAGPKDPENADLFAANISTRFGLMPAMPEKLQFDRWPDEFLETPEDILRALYLKKDWSGLWEADDEALASAKNLYNKKMADAASSFD